MQKNAYILDWPKIWKDLNHLDRCYGYPKEHLYGVTAQRSIKFLVDQQLRDKKIIKKNARVIPHDNWNQIFACFNKWYRRQGKLLCNPKYFYTQQRNTIRTLVENILIKRGIKPPKQDVTTIKKVVNREESIILED